MATLPLTIYHRQNQVEPQPQHALPWRRVGPHQMKRIEPEFFQRSSKFQRTRKQPQTLQINNYGTEIPWLLKHIGLGLVMILAAICWRCMIPSSSVRQKQPFFVRPHNQLIPLLVHSFPTAPPRQYFPSEPDENFRENAKWTDYGGLDIMILFEDGEARSIYHDFEMDQGMPPTARQTIIKNGDPNDDNDMDEYYAFDDDVKRSPLVSASDDAFAHERRCRRTNWHRFVFPTCNRMHELSVASNVPKYLR
jgi:hypothetical protein